MKFTIKGELTDLNKYINSMNRNRFIGNKVKQQDTELVMWQTKNIKKVTEQPVFISIDWYTPDIKKDPDNVAFAKKSLLDGLVKNGILENDGRKQICGFTDKFFVDKVNPRLEVEIVSQCGDKQVIYIVYTRYFIDWS